MTNPVNSAIQRLINQGLGLRKPSKAVRLRNVKMTHTKTSLISAGPHTFLNHLYRVYKEGLERLRRMQTKTRAMSFLACLAGENNV